METKNHSAKGALLAIARFLLLLVLCVASLAGSAWLLEDLFMNNSDPGDKDQNKTIDYAMMDRYDMAMTNTIANSLDGILSIKKVYWLSDDDQVAPEPNQAYYGETDDPSTLQWLLDEAAELLDGQTT